MIVNFLYLKDSSQKVDSICCLRFRLFPHQTSLLLFLSCLTVPTQEELRILMIDVQVLCQIPHSQNLQVGQHSALVYSLCCLLIKIGYHITQSLLIYNQINHFSIFLHQNCQLYFHLFHFSQWFRYLLQFQDLLSNLDHQNIVVQNHLLEVIMHYQVFHFQFILNHNPSCQSNLQSQALRNLIYYFKSRFQCITLNLHPDGTALFLNSHEYQYYCFTVHKDFNYNRLFDTFPVKLEISFIQLLGKVTDGIQFELFCRTKQCPYSVPCYSKLGQSSSCLFITWLVTVFQQFKI